MAPATATKPKTKAPIAEEPPVEVVAPALSEKEKKKLEKMEKRDRNKEAKLANNKEKKKGGLLKFFLFFVLLVMIGASVAIVVYNSFGVRDKYVYPWLSGVPFLGSFIPEPVSENDEYAELTREDLIQQMEQLMAENEAYKENIARLEEKNKQNVEDMTRLKELEEQQLQFKDDKLKFDTLIANNDPKAYETFYRSVYPENADNFYKEILRNNQISTETKNYVATFTTMDSSSAAAMLEKMITSDMNLVILILKNTNTETRGAILSEMTPENAARVVRMMAPKTQP